MKLLVKFSFTNEQDFIGPAQTKASPAAAVLLNLPVTKVNNLSAKPGLKSVNFDHPSLTKQIINFALSHKSPQTRNYWRN